MVGTASGECLASIKGFLANGKAGEPVINICNAGFVIRWLGRVTCSFDSVAWRGHVTVDPTWGQSIFSHECFSKRIQRQFIIACTRHLITELVIFFFFYCLHANKFWSSEAERRGLLLVLLPVGVHFSLANREVLWTKSDTSVHVFIIYLSFGRSRVAIVVDQVISRSREKSKSARAGSDIPSSFEEKKETKSAVWEDASRPRRARRVIYRCEEDEGCEKFRAISV